MVELVADLIKEGAEVNEKNHGGSTSLHCASENGHAAVVQTLLQHGADVAARNNRGQTALDWAEDCDDEVKKEEVKTALREHGAKHSLFYAAEKGMVEQVADLIKEGADVNDKNDVSLKCARNRACAGACPECRVPCAGERHRLPRPLLSLWPRR